MSYWPTPVGIWVNPWSVNTVHNIFLFIPWSEHFPEYFSIYSLEEHFPEYLTINSLKWTLSRIFLNLPVLSRICTYLFIEMLTFSIICIVWSVGWQTLAGLSPNICFSSKFQECCGSFRRISVLSIKRLCNKIGHPNAKLILCKFTSVNKV